MHEPASSLKRKINAPLATGAALDIGLVASHRFAHDDGDPFGRAMFVAFRTVPGSVAAWIP